MGGCRVIFNVKREVKYYVYNEETQYSGAIFNIFKLNLINKLSIIQN